MGDREQAFRLSPRQRRLWELQRAGVPTGSAATIRLSGALDAKTLERALERVVARHEILRTAIRRLRGVKTPVQVILATGSPRFEVVGADTEPGPETGGRPAWLSAEPVDLEAGRPLSAVLRRVSSQEHRLDLRLPALAADGRSLLHLAREIGRSYQAMTGGTGVEEEAVQYLQFSEWQNAVVDERGQEGSEHWAGKDLATLEALRLPLEESAETGVPESVRLGLDGSDRAAIDALAARRDTGAEPLLLSLWLALLGRLDSRAEPAVAHVFSGRRFPQLEEAVGAFAQAVPVGADLSDDPSLEQLLPRVEAALQEAYDWQELYEPGERAALGFEVLELPPPEVYGGVTFDVEAVETRGDRFRHHLAVLLREPETELVFEFDPGALSRERAETLVRYFRRLIGAAAAHPGTPLGALPILGPEEREQRLAEPNRTAADYPRERLVHELFEEQATRDPRAVALQGGDGPVTYGELDARAERVARSLRGAGVGPEDVVAVHARRGTGLVAGLLGVLKSGGAFLPLDPDLPPQRLRMMIEDAGARVLLTSGGGDGLGELAGVHRLPIDGTPEEGSDAASSSSAAPENLAYVLYTSGSTGRPKGVMVQHRGLVNYIAWCRRNYPCGQGTAVPLHSSIGFDLTLTSLFVPLSSGGRVVLVPEEEGFEALADGGADGAAFGFVKLTPSHLELLRRQLGDEASSRLAGLARAFIFGGEALFAELLAPWSGTEARLINEYGPTEAVVGCASFELAAGDLAAGRVPVGRPIANLRLYVVDRYLEPVPVDVSGELYVGGDGVARGYFGRPAATAAVFVPDPFAARPGERLYRSGDVARHRADGELEFLGRADHQLKIRGYRVEPGEIETVLRRHPSIAEAVTIVREDEPGNRLLVAYLVHRGPRPSVTELRAFLREVLPEPLVPNAFVSLEALPLTPSGKVDRRALPAPESGRPDLEEQFVAPRTPVETVIAEMWSEVLNVDRVGVDDDFFELGGHSLLATQVISRVRHRFEIDLPVRSLFDAPTVASWARLVEGAQAEKAGGLDEVLDEVQDMSDDEVDRLLRELQE